MNSLERFSILILRHQRLRQPVLMAGIVRISFDGFAVGIFRFGEIFILRIRVAEKIVDIG